MALSSFAVTVQAYMHAYQNTRISSHTTHATPYLLHIVMRYLRQCLPSVLRLGFGVLPHRSNAYSVSQQNRREKAAGYGCLLKGVV